MSDRLWTGTTCMTFTDLARDGAKNMFLRKTNWTDNVWECINHWTLLSEHGMYVHSQLHNEMEESGIVAGVCYYWQGCDGLEWPRKLLRLSVVSQTDRHQRGYVVHRRSNVCAGVHTGLRESLQNQLMWRSNKSTPQTIAHETKFGAVLWRTWEKCTEHQDTEMPKRCRHLPWFEKNHCQMYDWKECWGRIPSDRVCMAPPNGSGECDNLHVL